MNADDLVQRMRVSGMSAAAPYANANFPLILMLISLAFCR
jgi:hypothetical protein